MVLAAVDDLLFASKIRGAASRLGREVVFVKSTEAAIEQASIRPPDVILVDLDSRRLDPLGLVAAVRATPALARVPVIAFVSHVRADLVAAARQAGASQVLARSAFVGQLADIVAGPP